VLIQGDALEEMRKLDDATFTSCFCDPPYGLSKTPNMAEVLTYWLNDVEYNGGGGGFMSKKWDSFVPGPLYWKEVYRLLKPGAVLLAFAGTRTADLLSVAIRLAGFEKFDEIAWLYGCVDEETEVLTPHGWERNPTTIATSQILCYNLLDDTFAWHKPERMFIYDYNDTAYRIESDSTNQVVSRNHRCVVERGGKKIFICAEALKCKENIPILENMCGLSQTIYDAQRNAGTSEQGMQRKMQKCGYRAGQHWGASSRAMQGQSAIDMPDMWQEFLAIQVSRQEKQDKCLRPEMFGGLAGAKPRTFSAFAQDSTFGTSRVDGKEFSQPSQKHVGREQSCMEGRRDLFPQTRQLSSCQICAMSARVRDYGTQGWICDGASVNCSSIYRSSITTHRGCSLPRSRCDEQQPSKPGAIREQSMSQIIRSARFTTSSLATVTPIHYKGIMWCPQVPTGAFVARRHGKIFVTGNSGFPKSTAIGKQIDKAAGAKRQKIGEYRVTGNALTPTTEKGGTYGVGIPNSDPGYIPITAPATPEAKVWEGYGTAMKSAHEIILCFRKPRTGTYAQMALEYGTGALAIDACRIKVNGRTLREQHSDHPADDVSNHDFGSEHIGGQAMQGRWPANLLLSHSVGCEQRGDCVEGCPVKILGEQSGWLHGAGNKNPTRIGQGKNIRFNTTQENVAASRFNFGDSGTAAHFFQQFYYTTKAYRAERDAGLEGFTKLSGGEATGRVDGTPGLKNPRAGVGRTGEMRNPHPTVKPLALCKYLATLIRPPEEYLDDAALLVPFAGSGSEMIGAYLAGWRNVTGIELERKYVEIGHARITWWRRAMEQTGLTEPKAIIKAMKKPLPMFEGKNR